MKLYLLQHGEAKPKEEDPDRPLSIAGRADIVKTAAFAFKADLQISSILHSGKTRARQTSEILSDRLKPDRGVPQGGIL